MKNLYLSNLEKNSNNKNSNDSCSAFSAVSQLKLDLFYYNKYEEELANSL